MIEILTYKNKPILSLTDEINNKIHIQFGLKKAKLILQNLDEIKKFVENNSGEKNA